MKKLTFISCAFLLSANLCHAQGCIAIRNITSFGEFAQLGYQQSADQWVMDINSRYFKAYNVFQGTVKKTPADLRSGVTLYESTTNFELTRLLNNDWAISLDMPIDANETAGELEHASGDYHTTHAFGLADMRLTVYKWLLGATSSGRGNIQLGVGIKFPTGNYRTEDYFYTSKTDPTYRQSFPVNVAIQLGDGGTGITTQLNAFYFFNKDISVYGNFFYLISPKDQNGVPAWPPGLIDSATMALFHKATYDVNSVPDNYSLRAGANFLFGNFVATAGLRYEGAPAHDLIGGSDGLRRVGHIFSFEPGAQYKFKKSLLYCFVTLPLARATIATVPDERIAAITGTPLSITPGHFANFLVYVGYTFTFK
ncbi:MAG TPA: hypothetical protein VKR53_06955 [Puia sp.]|nr:hypothetical protein [Puia sp.]